MRNGLIALRTVKMWLLKVKWRRWVWSRRLLEQSKRTEGSVRERDLQVKKSWSWRMSIERWDPVASGCSCHVSSVPFSLSTLSLTIFCRIQFDSLVLWKLIYRSMDPAGCAWLSEERVAVEGVRAERTNDLYKEEENEKRESWTSLFPWQRLSFSAPFIDSLRVRTFHPFIPSFIQPDQLDRRQQIRQSSSAIQRLP